MNAEVQVAVACKRVVLLAQRRVCAACLVRVADFGKDDGACGGSLRSPLCASGVDTCAEMRAETTRIYQCRHSVDWIVDRHPVVSWDIDDEEFTPLCLFKRWT